MTSPLRHSPLPQQTPNPLGCLVFPIFLTIFSLSLGTYLAIHWDDYTALPHIVTIILLTLGSIVALILLIFFLILITAYRLARRLKKDAANLVDTARYMVNMNPNAPMRSPIDVTATEVPEFPDDPKMLTDSDNTPDTPTENPPDFPIPPAH